MTEHSCNVLPQILACQITPCRRIGALNKSADNFSHDGIWNCDDSVQHDRSITCSQDVASEWDKHPYLRAILHTVKQQRTRLDHDGE